MESFSLPSGSGKKGFILGASLPSPAASFLAISTGTSSSDTSTLPLSSPATGWDKLGKKKRSRTEGVPSATREKKEEKEEVLACALTRFPLWRKAFLHIPLSDKLTDPMLSFAPMMSAHRGREGEGDVSIVGGDEETREKRLSVKLTGNRAWLAVAGWP